MWMCPPTRLWLSPAPRCKPSVPPQDAAETRGGRTAHREAGDQPVCMHLECMADAHLRDTPRKVPSGLHLGTRASKESHDQVHVATG